MQVRDTEAKTTERRAACYRLFSAAFCLPGESFFAEEDVHDFATLLSGLDSEAAGSVSAMAGALAQTARDDLVIEYSRLFVGPFTLAAPPYGSVYLDDGRRLMGDSTIDAVRHYREVGIDMDPVHHDVPDHIAVELEFMSYLLHLEQVAAEQGDESAVADSQERQQTFLEKHLCAWVPTFAERIEPEAQCEFYRELVRATNAFVTEDLERLRAGNEA